MTIDKELFCFLLGRPNVELTHQLDRVACQCHYVFHWTYNMNMGSWNPEVNEMDYELRDVHTAEELYEFLMKKHHAL